MTFNIIQNALAMGYTAKQVLGLLGSKMPTLKKGIAQAQKEGYPEELILRFLSNQIPSKNPKEADQEKTAQQRYLKNIGITTSQERDETRNQFLKNAAEVGLAGVAAYRLGSALGYIGRSASQMGTPSSGPQAPTQPKPPIGQPIQPSKPQPQLAPPAGQATAQTPGPLTPNVPRTPNPKHADIIKQMGVENVIERLAGKEDPATIAKVLEQHFLKPAQKKWLSEQTSEPLQNVIQDYLSARPKEAEITPEKPTADLLSKAMESVEKEPVNTVLTPSGDIGTTIKEGKGVASVDVDGKQKNFREQDVIKAPIPEKDIADIYQELIDKIPESERSAVINVAGYDSDNKELIVVYHSGTTYTFNNIPEEFVEKLKHAMFEAKTTGKNFYGAWGEGKASRNAGLSKLIKELQDQYGGKGKEYSRKYENVYDFLAIPKAAVKERERKKREEERARQGKKPRKPRKPRSS